MSRGLFDCALSLNRSIDYKKVNNANLKLSTHGVIELISLLLILVLN